MAAGNQLGAKHALGLQDLLYILTDLHQVRGKWYNIGLQLKVSVKELQRIESEYKNDHDTCLRQMLIKWLESGKGSWESLCKALESPMVQGEDNLFVTKLREKYCKVETKKAKKRLPSEAESRVGETTTTAKKPKVALPDTFAPENFINMPSSDRCCVKCGAVPTNPQRSACCKLIYCEPCSTIFNAKVCATHQIPLSFERDTVVRQRIMELRSNCPNWRDGCPFKDAVLKVYRNHLPDCQYQATPSGSSNQAAAMKTYGQSVPKQSMKQQPKAKVSLIKCKYHRIGCWGNFASQKKMEQHLEEKVQQHLDLAICKIEELMDSKMNEF